MGVGYLINCKKCDYSRSVDIGVGMLHFSLDEEIKSTPKKEQQLIHDIIKDKQDLISESEGYSVFQCEKCCSMKNKFHIKIKSNDKILYETKPKCFKCDIKMRLLICDQDRDIIKSIKCANCKTNEIELSLNLMWD